MWTLYRMAKEFGSRPSDIMGITGEARRLMFDNAVFTFGIALSNAISSVEGKNSKEIEKKTQRVVDKWLRDPNAPKRYRDPAKRNEEV